MSKSDNKKKNSILVVDDEPDMIDTLIDILSDIGYKVDFAFNGKSAIDKIQTYSFDVVLMDIVMPGISGIEAYRRISKIIPGIKVILMTAYTDPNLIQEALALGVYDCISKPFPPQKIIQLINNILNQT